MLYTLEDYLNVHFQGKRSAFAKHCGVRRCQVTQWLSKGYFVANGVLVSPRRKLPALRDPARLGGEPHV